MIIWICLLNMIGCCSECGAGGYSLDEGFKQFILLIMRLFKSKANAFKESDSKPIKQSFYS